MNLPNLSQVKHNLVILAFPVTTAFVVLGWANEFLEFHDRFGILASLFIAVCSIGWAFYVYLAKAPSKTVPSELVAKYDSKWIRWGSRIIASLAFLLACLSVAQYMFAESPIIASIKDLKIKAKDVFHTLPDHKLLHYSFVCEDSKISTFAPSDTGIAFHFRLAKSKEFDWIQLVEVKSEVHHYEKHPKVTQPKVVYPAVLQPLIIVVPIKPQKGNVFPASIIFKPLDEVQGFSPSATTHRLIRLLSLKTQPIEVHETSPQPFVVLITAEEPGIYEMSVSIRVVSDKYEQWIPLCQHKEFTFTTPEIVKEAIDQWPQLSAGVREILEKQRTDYFSSQ